MEKKPKRRPLAKQLRNGLEKALRPARDEITVRTISYKLPDEPTDIDAPTLSTL
jgi:hypothetical protein